jgi:hypothetical protein
VAPGPPPSPPPPPPKNLGPHALSDKDPEFKPCPTLWRVALPVGALVSHGWRCPAPASLACSTGRASLSRWCTTHPYEVEKHTTCLNSPCWPCSICSIRRCGTPQSATASWMSRSTPPPYPPNTNLLSTNPLHPPPPPNMHTPLAQTAKRYCAYINTCRIMPHTPIRCPGPTSPACSTCRTPKPQPQNRRVTLAPTPPAGRARSMSLNWPGARHVS